MSVHRATRNSNVLTLLSCLVLAACGAPGEWERSAQAIRRADGGDATAMDARPTGMPAPATCTMRADAAGLVQEISAPFDGHGRATMTFRASDAETTTEYVLDAPNFRFRLFTRRAGTAPAHATIEFTTDTPPHALLLRGVEHGLIAGTLDGRAIVPIPLESAADVLRSGGLRFEDGGRVPQANLLRNFGAAARRANDLLSDAARLCAPSVLRMFSTGDPPATPPDFQDTSAAPVCRDCYRRAFDNLRGCGLTVLVTLATCAATSGWPAVIGCLIASVVGTIACLVNSGNEQAACRTGAACCPLSCDVTDPTRIPPAPRCCAAGSHCTAEGRCCDVQCFPGLSTQCCASGSTCFRDAANALQCCPTGAVFCEDPAVAGRVPQIGQCCEGGTVCDTASGRCIFQSQQCGALVCNTPGACNSVAGSLACCASGPLNAGGPCPGAPGDATTTPPTPVGCCPFVEPDPSVCPINANPAAEPGCCLLSQLCPPSLPVQRTARCCNRAGTACTISSGDIALACCCQPGRITCPDPQSPGAGRCCTPAAGGGCPPPEASCDPCF